jgi:hypothetical protein
MHHAMMHDFSFENIELIFARKRAIYEKVGTRGRGSTKIEEGTIITLTIPNETNGVPTVQWDIPWMIYFIRSGVVVEGVRQAYIGELGSFSDEILRW